MYVRIALIVLVIAAIVGIQQVVPTVVQETSGVTVVVTFPSLKHDVEALTCQQDRVYSLLPPNVDPHDYQLTPNDVKILKQADLIISTAHTPFELRIADMISSGELKATLIEIPKLNGMQILINPVTGKENMHMLIYDPRNYLIFINTLSNTLSKLNPACGKVYEENKAKVVKVLQNLISEHLGRSNLSAIGLSPLTQYAVSWLGVNIKTFLIVEHEVSPTPTDVSRVKELIELKMVKVLITIEGSEYSRYMEELSKNYNLPLIRVPPPYTGDTSVLDKIIYVVKAVENVTSANEVSIPPKLGSYTPELVNYLLILASFTIALLLAVVIVKVMYE